MCGIIGYIGKQTAAPILLEGLRRLEYRGYDSAGVAVLNGKMQVRKKSGKIDDGLALLLQTEPAHGFTGIGHTRWATHGAPTDCNSHPHLDQSGRIAVVHNGVIENYETIKAQLTKAGHTFASTTDTEVLAHLIGHFYDLVSAQVNLADAPHLVTQAVMLALKEVTGTCGVAVLCEDFPETIVAARKGSPLIIGIGDNEHFIASDANAIVRHTRRAVYLNDYEVATISPGDLKIDNLGDEAVTIQVREIEFGAQESELGQFSHYMLKEIYEQSRTVQNALRGRIDFAEATAKFGGLNMTAAELRCVDRIVITACGTSWHAGLIGEHLIEELAQIPVEVEYASEFRYRNAPLDKNTLVLAITQSGETADTLASLREAKRRGHKTLTLCNVVGSTIARETDGGIYLHAGPEIGVASTKAFTSQVTVLTLLAIFLGRLRNLSPRRALEIFDALGKVPEQIERILADNEKIKTIAEDYAEVKDFYFLGRLINFPVALEGALKLKEISYIHAEGYPAAELKHGPIALIDENSPSVILAPSDAMYDKVISNLEVVKARRGPVIAIATEGNKTIANCADDVIYVPKTLDLLFPLLAIIPLQLLAYHIAVARGCDVDKPRNLAKSVTVE